MATIYRVFALFHLKILHLPISLLEMKRPFAPSRLPLLFWRVYQFSLTTPLREDNWSLVTRTKGITIFLIHKMGFRVQSAYIPELGLSNRASNLMTGDEIKEQV